METCKNYRLGIYKKAMPDELSFEEKFILTLNSGYDFMEMSIDESDYRLSRLDFQEKDGRAQRPRQGALCGG